MDKEKETEGRENHEFSEAVLDIHALMIQHAVSLSLQFLFLCPCATLKIPTYKFFYLKKRAPVSQREVLSQKSWKHFGFQGKYGGG